MMLRIKVLFILSLLCLSVFVLGCGEKNTVKPLTDKIAPTIAITQPSPGDVLFGKVTISIKVSDNQSIAYTQLYFNDALVISDSSFHNKFEWDTTVWDDGHYFIYAMAYDNSGNFGVSDTIAVEVHNQFVLKLYNFIFTPIEIDVVEQGQFTINPFDSLELTYDTNPDTIAFSAETYGRNSEGVQLGSAFTWDVVENVNGIFSRYYSLDIDSTWFFLYMKNTATSYSYLFPVYINYNSAYEIQEDILIPPDNVLYSIGYYRAFSSTQIRADIAGVEPIAYRLWKQGTDFTFPFTINQYVLLKNSFLAKANEHEIELNSSIFPQRVIYQIPEKISQTRQCLHIYGRAQ
ncbi:hypothetical protein JW960_19050 [candidate division KSB1 bacterium]|nr:hypothetical protein [candidate division KSB1 bacterium]